MTPADLIEFEKEVADAFRAKKIPGPIHLSGGNEAELIKIFRWIGREDWVFSTYRSHYHALLHGVPRAEVTAKIMAGHSMNLSFPDHRFITSAIVGGCLPIAVGVAAAIKRAGASEHVWCFVGDMAASIGTFADCQKYAQRNDLPLRFIVEDNGLSCDSPTDQCWGIEDGEENVARYTYKRRFPHVGIGEFIKF